MIRVTSFACAAVLAVIVGCSGSSSSSDGGDGGSGSGSGSSGGSGSSSGGNGSSGSSGSSSGGKGGSSSGNSGSSSGVSVNPGDGGGACLGASLLETLGKKQMIIGGQMQAATAKLAPFDFQYIYIAGGINDGTGPCTSCTSNCTTGGSTSCSGASCAWWGCWQDTSQPPGDYVRGYASTCSGESPAQIPMVTYYQLLQAAAVGEGSAEVTSAATNQTFMTRYLADWTFLVKQFASTQAILHVEPDFWGYAEQAGSDPTKLPAAVASADAADCGSLPNTIAGMGQCMIAIARKYAPKALVGLHASTWSTGVDVSLNTSTSLDVAGEAQKTAAFLAACGESDADFVVVETRNHDAGYDKAVESQNTWWDATNATLPNYTQDFAWVKALTEALNKPALYWQTPLGNMSLPNTNTKYQDNRLDYFFQHMSEVAAAHAVGIAFGTTESACTQPETDNGHFVDTAKAYYAAGGQGLCP